MLIPALAAALTLASAPSSATDRPLVVIVLPESHSADQASSIEASIRLRGELDGAGVEVRTIESTGTAEAPDDLQRIARQQHAVAAIALAWVPGAETTDLWIADRRTGNFVHKRVDASKAGGKSAEVLAIRTAEVVRANLVDVFLPPPLPAMRPPTTRARPPTLPPPTLPPPTPPPPATSEPTTRPPATPQPTTRPPPTPPPTPPPATSQPTTPQPTTPPQTTPPPTPALPTAPPTPPPSTTPPPPPTTISAVRQAAAPGSVHLRLAAGPTGLFVRGAPPALAATLDVGLLINRTWLVRALASGLATKERIDAGANWSDLTQSTAMVQAQYRRVLGWRLSAGAGLGAGLLHVAVQGYAAPPLQGVGRSQTSFCGAASVALNVGLGSTFELSLESQALVAAQPADVWAASSGPARIGQPTVLVMATLAVMP